MSMAMSFNVVTNEQLEQLKAGTLDFAQVEAEANQAFEAGDDFKSAGLDLYTMDFIEYVSENDEPLLAILEESESLDELEETVMFARLFDKQAIANVISAFTKTDLQEFVSDMGEDVNDTASNSLYKTLIHIKEFFENAQKNDYVIVSSAI